MNAAPTICQVCGHVIENPNGRHVCDECVKEIADKIAPRVAWLVAWGISWKLAAIGTIAIGLAWAVSLSLLLVL